MAKKIWKTWTLRLPEGMRFERAETGKLYVANAGKLSPNGARRLFQKLSSDYKD